MVLALSYLDHALSTWDTRIPWPISPKAGQGLHGPSSQIRSQDVGTPEQPESSVGGITGCAKDAWGLDVCADGFQCVYMKLLTVQDGT